MKYFNNIKNLGAIKYYENTNYSLPVACIFGDSFFNSRCHILSQFFSKLYFFHYWGFDIELIEAIKPDIVLNENVERFISFSRNAPFKDIFNIKLFHGDFDNYFRIKELNDMPDHITSINHSLAKEYLGAVDQVNTRENFYRVQYNFNKEHGFHREQAPGYWEPGAQARFTSWAIGLEPEEIVQCKAIRLYFAGLFFNALLSFNVFPFPKNINFFNLSGIRPLYTQEISRSQLDVHLDHQRIIFPFLAMLKKIISKQRNHVLFVIHGDNYLGIGKTAQIYPEIWQRGYYALNFSSHFHPVQGGSIEWSLIKSPFQ